MKLDAVTKKNPPLYRELADEVQQLIDQRSLRSGQKLPSVRVTARQRQISIGTVIQAYVVLENRGYVEARPKSGYFVRRRPMTKVAIPPGGILGPAARVTEKDLAGHMIELAADPTYFPLGTACPAPTLFPLIQLARVAASVGRSDPGVYGRHAMGRPFQPLTQDLSRRSFLTGTSLAHDDFIITSGCGDSIHLALAAATRPGDIVLVESPAYFGYLRIIASLGLKAVEVPVDLEKGLSLEALRVALDIHAAKAVIVTPSYHNPTGACMSNARKQELYAILCDHDVMAVEDDIYGDLHYGAVRPKPLKAWDREGRVMLCSSLSKTLSPGLSLGWLVAGRYRARVDEIKWSDTSMLAQKIAARFFQDGYDRHLRRLRGLFQSQVAAVRHSVRTFFPRGTRVTEPTGGYVVWVRFPEEIDVLQLRVEALAKKIGTAPGPIFSLRNQYRNCLRLNCGLPWTPAFEEALRTLGRLATNQVAQARSVLVA